MGAAGDVALTPPKLWLPPAVRRQLSRLTGFSSRNIGRTCHLKHVPLILTKNDVGSWHSMNCWDPEANELVSAMAKD